MRLRRFILSVLVVSAAAHSCAPASAQSAAEGKGAEDKGARLIWDLLDVRDTLSYTLRRVDGAGDQPFFAACSAYGQIDLRFAAPLEGIDNEGEPVKITLTANSVSATVSGVSEIFQPTGSMRVFAKIDASDPVFAVLATGGSVRLERPAAGPRIWPAADPADVKLFVDACKTRSEH